MIRRFWQRLVSWFCPSLYHEPTLGAIARAERMERYLQEIEGEVQNGMRFTYTAESRGPDGLPRRFTR